MLNLPATTSTIRGLVEVKTLATMHRQDVPFLATASAAHRETMKADNAIKSLSTSSPPALMATVRNVQRQAIRTAARP